MTDRRFTADTACAGRRQGYALVGAGAAIVVAVLLVAFASWHRQRRASPALIDAVETAGDDGVRHAVNELAVLSVALGVVAW